MRAIFGLGLVVAVSALIAGCNKKDTWDRGNSVAIPPDGAYLLVALESDGEERPAASFTKENEAGRTLTLAGNQLISTTGGKEDALTLRWDPSKNPGHVTVIVPVPGGRPETNYGIYKMEGDLLTICMADGGEANRPTQFKTSKGSNAHMMTLKKQ